MGLKFNPLLWSGFTAVGSSSGGGGVTTLNSLAGALTIAPGTNITVTPSGGNTLTIASTVTPGANTALSNLITTAINQNLIFNTGSAAILKTKDDTITSQDFLFTSGDSTAGNSGNLVLTTGTAAGTQGSISIGPGTNGVDNGIIYLTSKNVTADGQTQGGIFLFQNYASISANVPFSSNVTFTTDNTFNIGSDSVNAQNVNAYNILSKGLLVLEADGGGIDVLASDEHFNIRSYNGSIAASLNLWDKDDNFSAWVKAPDTLVANTLFQVPGTNGTNGGILTTNGSGVTSWQVNLYNTNNEVKLSFDTANTTIQSGLAGTLASGTVNVKTLASVAAGGSSGEVQVTSGNADLASGNASMFTGDSANASTGHIIIYSGNVDSDASNSGALQMTSGLLTSATAAGNTGGINLASGDTEGIGNSGDAFLHTGDSTSGNSGNIQIYTGAAGIDRGFISLDAGEIGLNATGNAISFDGGGQSFALSATDGITFSGSENVTMDALFLNIPQGVADPVGTHLRGGAVYYNTVLNKIKMYNGVTWETITSV